MGRERAGRRGRARINLRTIRTTATRLLFLWLALAPAPGAALGPEQVAVIVNAADPYSVEIGAYYARRRGIPPANVIPITLPTGQAAMSGRSSRSGRPSSSTP